MEGFVELGFEPCRVVLPDGGNFSHNLLGQNIEGVLRNFQALQVACPNGGNQGSAFDEFIAGGGEDATFRLGTDPVPCPADALERHRDVAWRPHLTNEIHRANVDA